MVREYQRPVVAAADEYHVWLVRPGHPHAPPCLVSVPTRVNGHHWEDTYGPGGFRLATAAEIARWRREQEWRS